MFLQVDIIYTVKQGEASFHSDFRART